MTQDHLGLFDTPPSRRQIRSGIAIVVLTWLVMAVTLPVRDVRLGEIVAFVPIAASVMISPGAEQGATFHLQLPSGGAAAA